MFKTLKNIDSDVAQSVLAEVAQSLLPKPTTAQETKQSKVDDSLHAKVLEEAYQRARVNPEKLSPEDKGALFRTISKEISYAVFKGQSREQAMARLGESGDLRSDQYRIIFDGHFKPFERLGIKRSEIKSAITHPDQTQHLRSELTDSYHISLFTKAISGRKQKDDSIILVQAKREATNLTVLLAWRIYPRDVDVKGCQSPLELLKAFLEIYGVDFKAGSSSYVRFLLYDSFLVQPNASMAQIFQPKDIGSMVIGSWVAKRVLHTAVVAVAYAVNYEKYKAALMSHGASAEFRGDAWT